MNRVETTKSLAAESRGAVWLKAVIRHDIVPTKRHEN